MKKHFSTLLIIAGVLIIMIPLAGRFIAARRQADLMETFLEETMGDQASEDEVGALTDALEWGALEGNQDELDIGLDGARASVDALEGVASEGDTTLSEAGTIKSLPDAIGTIRIDKIDVYLPVAEGVDLATLKFALGHMPETADLGEVGNAVVAGHRSHSFGTYFNRLDEIVIGDEIEVQANGNTYTYEVYEVLVVEPDDLSVLRSSSDHQVLTLITCTPLYTSTHRLIVHAVVQD